MGRLIEPVSNGRARLMIEVPLGEYKTRLTDLLLYNIPLAVYSKGLFFF
jgi:hypothetical protein